MKCINCGIDNNLKDRRANQGRCKQCQHCFVFEPNVIRDVKLTDSLFAKVIAEISANNTLFFTPKQLFYLLHIRLKYNRFEHSFSYDWERIINYNQTDSTEELNNTSPQANDSIFPKIRILILLLGVFVIPFLYSLYGWGLLIILYILLIVLRQLERIQEKKTNTSSQEKTNIFQWRRILLSESQFQDWLNKWQEINGVPPTILPSPREELAPATINPDVTAYSFDRLVVCDSAAIAQLLIANNFHFENNCAILSITGYPQSIFATIMQMLHRNPDLRVYALHDCTPKGLTLVNHLRTSDNWFLNSDVAIIDVGILPRQIIANQGIMFIQTTRESAQASQELAVHVRLSLTAEELFWLDYGNFVELESFTPKRLIQVLRNAISRSQNLKTNDNKLTSIGDSGIDIYAVESFG